MAYSKTAGALGATAPASDSGWAKPLAGKTTLVITLKDYLGQTTTGNVAVTINPA